MLRPILAVIASYIVMVILIMSAFAALLFGIGIDRLLEPGTWKGNMFFSAAVPAITASVGLFGGWMCAKVARTKGPVLALAAVVLVLGFTSAYFTLQKPEPTGPREPNMTMKEFREKGREPAWVALSNPILGAIGVLCAGLGTVRAAKSPR